MFIFCNSLLCFTFNSRHFSTDAYRTKVHRVIWNTFFLLVYTNKKYDIRDWCMLHFDSTVESSVKEANNII